MWRLLSSRSRQHSVPGSQCQARIEGLELVATIGVGGYKLSGLDPGSVVKAKSANKVVSNQWSVISKSLKSSGFLLRTDS